MAFTLLLLLFFLSIAADRNPNRFTFTDLVVITALYSITGGLLISSIFGN